MSETFWASDFAIQGAQVRVKKTGADVRVDPALLADIATWLTYYIPVRARAAVLAVTRPGPAIWFAPDAPRPWYLAWLAAAWAGVRFVRSPRDADAAFYFEDATTGDAPPLPAGCPAINFACTDVSKSHVAAVFEQVFGYPLAVDPAVWRGPAAEKGELNGAHDGRVVDCPRPPAAGRVYQRLIDNVADGGGHIEDLRTPCIGGRPVLVFLKRRPLHDRFANYNTSVALRRPQDLFSAEELEQIAAFAAAMHLDWGGLDILRDRGTGRLYIVDVNKTDMPPLRLPWRDKIRAVAMLAEALKALVADQALAKETGAPA